jgi:hypothetical protein
MEVVHNDAERKRMVVKNSATLDRLWIARDSALSGMYTVWCGGRPDMNAQGFFKCGTPSDSDKTLLITVHPSKWPLGNNTLEPGEVRQVFVIPMLRTESSAASQAAMGLKPTNDKGQDDVTVQQGDTGRYDSE